MSRPASVILERPAISPADVKGVNVFTVSLDRDLSVCVGRGHRTTPLAPSVARYLASVIAAYADAAEAARNEPDEAAVCELAEHLARERSGMPHATKGDFDSARTALRWMKDKQQQGGTE